MAKLPIIRDTVAPPATSVVPTKKITFQNKFLESQKKNAEMILKLHLSPAPAPAPAPAPEPSPVMSMVSSNAIPATLAELYAMYPIATNYVKYVSSRDEVEEPVPVAAVAEESTPVVVEEPVAAVAEEPVAPADVIPEIDARPLFSEW